jgi:hypothetical protein
MERSRHSPSDNIFTKFVPEFVRADRLVTSAGQLGPPFRTKMSLEDRQVPIIHGRD